MTTHTVDLVEAKDRLAELLQLARRGDDVFISDVPHALAKIVAVTPITASKGQRVLGQFAGQVHLEPNFDDPLSEFNESLERGIDA
jgi:antitoxin (DNA-binding transcriptional repressor) of toxin-antitoxin stability system